MTMPPRQSDLTGTLTLFHFASTAIMAFSLRPLDFALILSTAMDAIRPRSTALPAIIETSSIKSTIFPYTTTHSFSHYAVLGDAPSATEALLGLSLLPSL